MDTMVKITKSGNTIFGDPMASPGHTPSGGINFRISGTDGEYPSAVLRQFARVAIFPMAAVEIPWSRIKGQPQGAMIFL